MSRSPRPARLFHTICSLLLPFCLCLSASLAARLQAQTAVSIHDIMVTSGTYPLPNSPYLYAHYGQPVSVTGVVVGVMATGDFTGSVYISEPSGSWDNLVATAEGMPVFNLTALNPACAVVGASVTIIGEVVESNTVVPADITAANTPGTGLLPTSCTVNSTGNTMTQSISLGSTLNSFGGALEYTGMTTTATFYAVQPTTGTLAESSETQTSTGQFWATLSSNTSTNNHLFRSAGIAKDEYVPSTAPATVATWAGNPQRILIDTTTFGGSPVNITVGQTISCTTGSSITVGATKGIGLIDYTLGYARLLIFPTSVCTVGGSVATSTSAAADSTHFHVGTLDLYRFYSTTGATSGSVPISSTAYTRRLAKAALAIVNSLGKPDIVSLQEVQDLPTLTDLANAVNTLASTNYQPYLQLGNDPNSLNLGFLVNTSTVVVDSVTQVEASSTYTTASNTTATLWQRPPLVLQAEFVRTGKNYPVTVLDAHLTPRDNIGDTTLGPNVRAQRAAQATDLSALVQTYQTAGDNVIVAGNLNSFEFSDGYVDVTGILDGSPSAASAVTLYEPTSTTAALTDLVTQVTAYSRYNAIVNGDAEVLEHILASATVPDSSTASASLASYVTAVTQPHFTADFAAVDLNDATTPAGLTPHDGLVVSFLIPPVPTTASVSATTLNFGNVSIGSTASLTTTVTNTTTFTSTVNITNIAITGANAADYSQTSTCTALAEAQTCTVTVTFAPSATGTRTATLTLSTDATSGPTLTVSLTGVGIPTTATLTPTSATFPNTYAGGGVSTAQLFTLTNTSTAVSISVGAITVSSTNFTIAASTCTTTLAAGASCTISVTFTPTASGALTGTLTVLNGSTADPTLTASLSGTGLPTTATLTPASATFANTVVGATSPTIAFTWTNTSSIALSIKSTTVTGAYAISSTTCSGTIAANSSCILNVAFAPTALGTATGTLTVTSTSSANPTLTAALTGLGVADVEASASTLSFGNVDLGSSSAAQTLTITNYTNAAISLTSLTITGDYSYTTTCGSTLAGLATCTVTIVFTPTALGVRTGTLTLNTSDTKYPVIAVALTGNGVDFSIAVTPTSGSLIAGFYTSVNLTLTPLGGFSAPITLTCTTAATGSTCTPAATAITLAAVTTDAVKITTTSHYTVIGYGGLGANRFLALLAAATGLLLLSTRRRNRQLPALLLLLLLLASASLGLSGCGSTPAANSQYTEAGTYTYTFTATDGTVIHTATYTLTVTKN